MSTRPGASSTTVIGAILPAGVESAELFGDAPGGALLPAEEAVVAGAVARRRREFTAVRACARVALQRLGHPRVAIIPGHGGAPIWPSGVVGSMTHCAGYCAAAVASDRGIAAVGIDAERDVLLPDGVLRRVATPDEREHLGTLPHGDDAWPSWGLALFSAKESVFKAWFPRARRRLNPRDVEIRFSPDDRTFTALVPDPGSAGDGGPIRVRGRWTRTGGILLTAVTVPHRPGAPPHRPLVVDDRMRTVVVADRQPRLERVVRE